MKYLINFRTNSKSSFINNNGETFNLSQLSHHCCSNNKKKLTISIQSYCGIHSEHLRRLQFYQATS